MVQYISKIATKVAPNYCGVTLKNLLAYTPNLAIWGGASMAGIFVFTEGWPKFQTEIFQKIPVAGNHWVSNPDPQDLPQ